jgi:hypothetical protein
VANGVEDENEVARTSYLAHPVSRDILRGIADQFQKWLTNRAQKWDAPIVEAPRGRRDEFVESYFRRAKPDQVVVILKAREPARIMIAIGNKQDNRWRNLAGII